MLSVDPKYVGSPTLFAHLCGPCANKKTNTQKTPSDGNCSTMLICVFVYLCIHQQNHSLKKSQPNPQHCHQPYLTTFSGESRPPYNPPSSLSSLSQFFAVTDGLVIVFLLFSISYIFDTCCMLITFVARLRNSCNLRGSKSCDALLKRVEENDPALTGLVILPMKVFGPIDVDRLSSAIGEVLLNLRERTSTYMNVQCDD